MPLSLSVSLLMMTDSLILINDFLDSLFAYGPLPVYVAIFLACFVENVFPPFPGDTFIIGGGALVAANRLDLYLTMIVIVVGGMISTMLLYYLGVKYGREYFIRKNYSLFSARDIASVESRLTRWGGGVFIVSRFLVGVRSALSASAGIARYPAIKMIAYSLLSYLAFTSILMYLSITLVESFDVFARWFRLYQWIFWSAVGALFAAYIVWRLRGTKTNSARTE